MGFSVWGLGQFVALSGQLHTEVPRMIILHSKLRIFGEQPLLGSATSHPKRGAFSSLKAAGANTKHGLGV